MKLSVHLFILLIAASLLTACSTSYTPYAYDDVYYSPSDDPANKHKTDPREEFNKSNNVSYDGSYPNRYAEEEKTDRYPESLYDNRYTEAEKQENKKSSTGDTQVIINNNNSSSSNEEDVYYDEDYASSLNQINSPVRSFNTYDPYQRDRILYTQDPFFASPTLYGRYQFWDPFMPRTSIGLGWNSWGGWNVGVGYGMGFGYNNFYNPYSPFGGGFGYDPWNPYNRFGWNPYGGFGFNNYWNGYNSGFVNGFYSGRYHGGNNSIIGGGNETGSSSGRRYINTPRGSSGSPTYTKGDTDRPSREARKSISPEPKNNSEITNQRPSRSAERAIPASEGRDRSPSRVNESPERYKTGNSRDTYSRPQPDRPSRTSTPSRNDRPVIKNSPTQSTPSYTRPRQNNSYNRPSRVSPQERSQPSRQYTPQRQTTPSMERSRPSYNRSRSTPSYNSPSSRPSYSAPSRSSGGGGSSPSSRPSRPSRR